MPRGYPSNLSPEQKRAQAAERTRLRRANRTPEQKAADDEKARKRTADWREAHGTAFNARRRATTAEARLEDGWHHGSRMQAEDMSPLGRFIDEQVRLTGASYTELSVLSMDRDPFRFDRAAIHRDAKWFADQFAAVVPDGATIHLRGLHYRLVGRGETYARMPNGSPYRNNPECYEWLMHRAKFARYLGYVPFDRIIDNRNEEPIIIEPFEPEPRRGWAEWDEVCPIEMPDFDMSEPGVHLEGGVVRQPYQIILIGEKSSLKPELEPVQQLVNGELILPTGEMSDTFVYDMAKRAIADPRPSVVLYFSDFDPAGWNMPINVARRLQAIKVLYLPDLEIQVHHPAINLEICEQFDLPDTPLSEDEKRAGKWKQRFGREQTEIDAMIALHPGEIEKIARKAIEPFYDPTLQRRHFEAWNQWQRDADQILDESAEYQREVELLHERQTEARNIIRDAISSLNEYQFAATERIEALRLTFDEFDPPDVEMDAEAPQPLFDSRDDWLEQTSRLRDRRGNDIVVEGAVEDRRRIPINRIARRARVRAVERGTRTTGSRLPPGSASRALAAAAL